jgi:hypothetical protein
MRIGHVFGATAIVAALAILGSPIGPVAAQTSNRGAPAGNTPGGSGSGGAVVPYGTTANCPPTIACGPTEQKHPPKQVKKKVKKQRCDQWRTTADGTVIRGCRDPDPPRR